MHQIVRKKANLNPGFDKRSMSKHQFVFVRKTIYYSRDLTVDQPYYKLGTSMQDNIRLFVRPPKDGLFYTVKDAAKNVLAHARTIEEITVEWHKIDDQKVIVEKLIRQSSGSSNRFLGFD